ncbi:unnamed protein product [Brassica rapa subsp. trilocularis]
MKSLIYYCQTFEKIENKRDIFPVEKKEQRSHCCFSELAPNSQTSLAQTHFLINFLIMHHPLFYLLLILFIRTNQCSSSSYSSQTLVLPLKTRITPTDNSGHRPTDKLHFHHNVTLTVTLTVGTPPQNISMVIDTGSELSWLRCNRTSNPNPTNNFDPTLSSSYSPIPCSSPTCRTRTRDFLIPASCDSDKLCHATLSYADASSSEGNLAAEVFHIGNSTNNSSLIFGCMGSVSGSDPEEDSKTTGLLGMNRGSLSFISQMGFPKFSYCISGTDDFPGFLLLGDSNFTWLTPLNYTPLIRISTPLPYFDRVAYTVQLTGIKVNGKLLPIPKSVLVPDHTGAGQTMVDSGTQFTFLLGPVYTALRTEFLNQTNGTLTVYDEPDFVFQGTMDLCYLISPVRIRTGILHRLPSVSLVFEGAEIAVSGQPLLYRVPHLTVGNDSVYCFTFGNSDLMGMEAYVIGHHHQQNMWIEFDLQRSRIGLAPVQCDVSGQRLGIES